ncbi:MAG: N-acetylmuramoyl-L-alanine amidase [Firmicutes bacterium]|nr:N-acetylmuramoyl-L-alanine amidase [Candidatus Fermentithermobacillaceae bacterium]
MKPAVVNAWSRMVLIPAEEGPENYRWTSTVVLECTCPPMEIRLEKGQTRSPGEPSCHPGRSAPSGRVATAETATLDTIEVEHGGLENVRRPQDHGHQSPGPEPRPRSIPKVTSQFGKFGPDLPFVAARELHAVDLSLIGLRCTMAPETVLVADGLVHSFKVAPSEERPDVVNLRVFLEHPVSPAVGEKAGLPHLVTLEFSREPVRQVFRGKSVVIDPGHGGRDRGFRGPVNLLEKNVAMIVSKNLYSLLHLAGARPHLTRRDDVAIEDFHRLRAATCCSADCLIKIHASGEDDPDRRAYFVRYSPHLDCSRALALEIRNALLERMGIDPALVEWDEFGLLSTPVVQVEPVCLTHYADEANFRAPLFQKRLAQSIFNGLMRWYMKGGNRGR